MCVEPSTAKRWVELGFAEIRQNSTGSNTVNESNPNATYEEKYPGAPPPPPTKVPSDVDAQCRDGQVLVYRLTHNDDFCINQYTAITWERLGLVEIINDLPSENIVETIELPLEEEQETIVEEEQEIFANEKLELVKTIPTHSDNSDAYPIIRQLNENIWNILDYDGSTSFFIEGDRGLIVIGSLNSYNSNKQIIDEFQKISTKEIRSVILTDISPEILFVLDAYTEKSDGVVDIVIYEDLLQHYEKNTGSKVKNTISFSNSLSVDVIGVDIELFTNDVHNSFQTLIYIPDDGGLIIGDSEYGMFPFFYDITHLSEFLNKAAIDDSKNDL